MAVVPSVLIPIFDDPGEARIVLAKSRIAAQAPLPDAVRASIRATFGEDLSPEEVVRRIIDDVRERGDVAIRHYTQSFDAAAPDSLLVPAEEVDRAPERVAPEVRAAYSGEIPRLNLPEVPPPYDAPEDKMITVIQKTWKKMTSRAHEVALGMKMTPAEKALIEKALANLKDE